MSQDKSFSPAISVVVSVLNVLGSTSESCESAPASLAVASYEIGKSENIM